MLSIGWWCSVPISEANLALGSVPMVYHCYIIPATLDLSFRLTPCPLPPHPPSPAHNLLFAPVSVHVPILLQ